MFTTTSKHAYPTTTQIYNSSPQLRARCGAQFTFVGTVLAGRSHGQSVEAQRLRRYCARHGSVLPGSHYRRLTRFMDKQSQRPAFQLDVQRQVFRMLRRRKYTHLLLDGSSWKRGGQKYHYLVLSVLAGSVAIPIYWKQLEKIGSSSQAERKALFEEARQYFDLTGMTLLADREYIGYEWFSYLKDQKINFVIRLRFSNYFQVVDNQPGKSYQQMYAAIPQVRCTRPILANEPERIAIFRGWEVDTIHAAPKLTWTAF